jgi:hypothetical protein
MCTCHRSRAQEWAWPGPPSGVYLAPPESVRTAQTLQVESAAGEGGDSGQGRSRWLRHEEPG